MMEIITRGPSPFDRAVIAIACLIVGPLLPFAVIALSWFLVIATPGQ